MMLQLHSSMKLYFAVIIYAAIIIVNIAAVSFVIVDTVYNVNAVAVIKDAAVAVVKCCCSCSCQ